MIKGNELSAQIVSFCFNVVLIRNISKKILSVYKDRVKKCVENSFLYNEVPGVKTN